MTAAGQAQQQSTGPLLSIRDLTIEVATDAGAMTAVDGLSLDLWPGEVVSIVGESGSGKSVTMLAIMGLLRTGRTRVHSSRMQLKGRELGALTATELQAVRGRDLSMIFQEPMTSLNPVLSIGRQIFEAIHRHQPGLGRRDVRQRGLALLERVGVADPDRRLKQFPHELSGGMRQRVVIAMAIANDPAVLIADEPTTALDVTIQAQVMDVLAQVGVTSRSAMILVTHDLGLVAENSDRMAVMYAGRIIETGPVTTVFAAPRHPYTASLLRSVPRLDSVSGELVAIPGMPPELGRRPQGCAFRPRCRVGLQRSACARDVPLLHLATREGRSSACHFPEEAAGLLALPMDDDSANSPAPIGSASRGTA